MYVEGKIYVHYTPSISGISPTHLPHTSGGMVTIYGIGFIAREQTHAILESYDNGKWRVDPETYNLNASMCGSGMLRHPRYGPTMRMKDSMTTSSRTNSRSHRMAQIHICLRLLLLAPNL